MFEAGRMGVAGSDWPTPDCKTLGLRCVVLIQKVSSHDR